MTSRERDKITKTKARPADPQRGSFAAPMLSRTVAIALGLGVLGAALPLSMPQITLEAHRAKVLLSVAPATALDATLFQSITHQLHNELTSDAALGALIRELSLTPEPLNVAHSPSIFELITDLIGLTKPKPKNRNDMMIEALRQQITVETAKDKPAHLEIGVDSNSEKQALAIANALGLRSIAQIGQFMPGGIDLQLNEARAALDKLEAERSGFQLRHGSEPISQMAALGQSVIQAKRLAQINRSALSAVQSANHLLEGLKGTAALNVTLPQDAGFDTLRALQESYSEAKSTLASLSAAYGPKHPKLMAAQSNLDALTSQTAKLLTQTRADLKDSLSAARERVAASEQALSDLDVRLAEFGEAPQELEFLEQRLETARQHYLSLAELSPIYAKQEMLTADIAAQPMRAAPIYNWSLLSLYSLVCGFAFSGLGFWVLGRFGRGQRSASRQSSAAPSTRTDSARHAAMVAKPAAREKIMMQEPTVLASPLPLPLPLSLPSASPLTVPDNAPQADHTIAQSDDAPFDVKVKRLLLGHAVKASDGTLDGLPPLVRAAAKGQIAFTQAEIRELGAIKRDLEHLRHEMRNDNTPLSQRSRAI